MTNWKTQWKLGTLAVLIMCGIYLGTGIISSQAGCGGSARGPDATLSPVESALSDQLQSLARVPVPQPVGGDVVDRQAAVRLGKALFWDQQLGSDGQMACATCHFQAGTDPRRMNVVHPGPDGIFQAGVSGPGMMWSPQLISSDDRIGSQGVHPGTFVSISADPLSAVDNCTMNPGLAPFMVNRGVTGRQTPSAVAAVFNRQNFWDGRANNVFNGANPFGTTGNAVAQARIEAASKGHGGDAGGGSGGGDTGGSGGGTGGNAAVVNASLASAAVGIVSNSALSSQAVGPPLSGTEMSCAGRAFNGANSLGAKMLARAPLQLQKVEPSDSVLGALSAAPGPGLKCGATTCSYRSMISAAFGATIAADAENQFSRIFGQAVQAYEATLIPDHTPFDKFAAGDRTALTAQQQRGLGIFSGKGSCTKCHAGAELTDASISFAAKNGLINEDGGDQGFHNIGVRPTAEDLGRAGKGPGGVPWSESGSAADHGAFKTPGLRNVKLTAPYFHNGGKPTLDDVVAFYSKGGDFKNPEQAKRISAKNFSSEEATALVDFLANGLTDCRVEMHQAPFDHPSLSPPNGPVLAAAGAGGYGSCR